MKYCFIILLLFSAAGCGATPTYVSGRVTSDGVPISGATVTVWTQDTPPPISTKPMTTTNAKGCFELRFPRVFSQYKKYHLAILKDGYQPWYKHIDSIIKMAGSLFVGNLNTQILNEISLFKAAQQGVEPDRKHVAQDRE